MSLQLIILANFIIIISSILQMATGVSVGMIIVPFLALISYAFIPTPIILASLVLTMMMSYKKRKHIDFKHFYGVSFGMISGIFIALFVFSNLKSDKLGFVFGVLILISVYISIKAKSFKLGSVSAIVGGVLAGTMGSLAAVGGQILALLYQNHTLDSIKATLAFLYSIFSVVMLIIFYYYGKFGYEDFLLGLYLMPGFLIGFYISPFFTKYFKDSHAKPAVLLMATLGAVILIVKSLL